MSRTAGALIVLCCALVIAQSLIVCGATGWRALTRFPDPELAAMRASEGSLASLFGGAGGAGPRLIPNDFALGLLPSPSFSRELISVATLAGPAILVMALVLPAGRRRARAARPGTPPAPPSATPRENSP